MPSVRIHPTEGGVLNSHGSPHGRPDSWSLLLVVKDAADFFFCIRKQEKLPPAQGPSDNFHSRQECEGSVDKLHHFDFVQNWLKSDPLRKLRYIFNVKEVC